MRRPNRIRLRAMAVVALVAACSGSGPEQDVATRQGTQVVDDAYLQQLVTREIGSYATIGLGDGAVLYGGLPTGGGEPALSTGVILDASGEVSVSFSTESALVEPSMTEVNDRIFVLGIPCTNVPRPDDVGNLGCAPNGLALKEITRASGEVRDVPLPDARLAEQLMDNTRRDIYAAGEHLVLVTPGPPGAVSQARYWLLDETGAWQTLPEPPGNLCQTQDHLLAIQVPPSDPGLLDGPTIPTATAPATAQVFVLDTGALTWGAPIASPPVTTIQGASLRQECTSNRAVLLPWSGLDQESTGLAFDPIMGTWDTVPVPPGLGAQEPWAWPTEPRLTYFPIPFDVGTENVVIDPVSRTSHVLGSPSSIMRDAEAIVPLTPGRLALLTRREGSVDILDLDDR